MKKVKEADYLFLILIAVHITAVLLISFMPDSINMSQNQSLIFSQALLILPVMLYMLIKKINPLRLISHKRADFFTLIMTMLFVMGIMPLVTFLNAFSMIFTENTVSNMASEMMSNSLLLNLILMAVMPAVFEEFVFRGILYHSYKEKSITYAAILSGIMFGLMHLNFNQFSYAFVLGIAFAFLLEATDSIYTTMLGHFMINANSVLSLKLVEKMYSGLKNNNVQMQDYTEILNQDVSAKDMLPIIGIYGFIAIFTTIAAIGIWIAIAKHNNTLGKFKILKSIALSEGQKISYESSENEEIKIIRPVMCIGIIVCIGYMLLVS